MNSSTPFTRPEDVYEWISGFINLESGQKRREYRPDNMNALADLAGRPEKCAPSIHVAGTKGKGSVTGMIGAILEASGKKTSCYFSPHVSNFRERLTMGKNFFGEDVYVKTGIELREYAEHFLALHKLKDGIPNSSVYDEPSFFELMMLWFFLSARMAGSEAMSVETGMGGRLDATNIINPLVSVITIIELEHTEYLGNSIAAIAGEKAGIIKPGRPLVLAEQGSEAFPVFREFAERNNSALIYFPDHVEIRKIHSGLDGTSFSVSLRNCGSNNIGENLENLFIPIPGEVQAKNAGLAILAAITAFPLINENDIRNGLASFRLPARFERISDSPPIVIDGSHTERSVDLCIGTFVSLYGRGNILIFGCAAGKNAPAMAECCIPHFSRIIITAPGTFKKSFPEQIYETFRSISGQSSESMEILFVPDTAEAICMAVKMALDNSLAILGTGSFYLAAEIREKVIGH